jgi:fructose-bisphosphate aldolase class II
MLTLRRAIEQAEKNKAAIGHFNISDLVMLKAIFEAARKVGAPVIVGLSEGEREFVGVRQAAAVVKSLREERSAQDGGFPIFLNADHTRSLEKVKEAAEAGFDAILFDPTPGFVRGRTSGGKFDLEENIRLTKQAVDIVKSINPNILVEGELGYIGSGSQILEKLPEGAAVRPEDMTKPEEAKKFVEETGVDLLAPAVGNIHGMLVPLESARPEGPSGARQARARTLMGFTPANPRLDIERIRAIRAACGAPIVLHGGSGIRDEDFLSAMDAGVSVIHVSTELRRAWREGMEEGLHKDEKESAPYKIAQPALAELEDLIISRLRLFSRL